MRYKRLSLRELPDELKPREKLLRKGERSLSDEELLAVILGSGTKEKDVLSLSEELISLGWEKLKSMSVRELTEFKGLGLAKALKIKALLELSGRIKNPFSKVILDKPEAVYRFLKERKLFDRKEKLVCLYLNTALKLLGLEVVAVGSLNVVFTSPKEILRGAVENLAYGLIVAHNHPSGELRPSREDLEFTKRLKSACELLEVQLIDHLIFCEEGYLSLRREGLLD